MRRLVSRTKLPKAVTERLKTESDAIALKSDPAKKKSEAERLFNNARKSVWFKPVIEHLKKMSGLGCRCMFCSGSEASDVEHYKPKSIYPDLAMSWTNYLWSCTPCNRGKLNTFPPSAQYEGKIINPVDEDVWEFFFVDQFGLLSPKYDIAAGKLNVHAVATRDILDLNREAVQEARQSRLDDLKEKITDVLSLFESGQITKKQINARIETWRKQPFQPDVADYFLAGPGKSEMPFKELFEKLEDPA